MIFGAMLINEFFVLGNLINDFFVLKVAIASKRNSERNATSWLIRARTEWQLCKDFEKFCSIESEHQKDFIVNTQEELEVVDQK